MSEFLVDIWMLTSVTILVTVMMGMILYGIFRKVP